MTWRKSNVPSENCPPEEVSPKEIPPKRKSSKEAVPTTTERLIDPATGKPYKSGEYPLARNEPIP
jgi:hypothetical protein